MSEHLTFDEITGFLESKSLDNETRKMAYRINEHISKCKECYDQYKALLTLDDQLGLLRLSDFCEEQYEWIEAARVKDDPSLTKRLSELVDKLHTCTSEIAFKVVSKKSLAIERARYKDDMYAFDFGHPIPIGARGDSEICANTTVLVDNENEANKVILTESGSIRVELESTSYTTGPLAFLVGEDGNAHMREFEEDTATDILICEFEDIDPGQYTLYIE